MAQTKAKFMIENKKFIVITISVVILIVFAVGLSGFLLFNRVKSGNVKEGEIESLRAYNNEAIKTANTSSGTLKAPSASDHYLGDLDAKVKIIIYSDLECPFCAEFEEIVGKIQTEYGNKVLLVFRHFPLNIHEEAIPAANALECAGEQNKFWEMKDKLFKNNKDGTMNEIVYVQNAEELGLDKEKFFRCVKSGKYKDRVLSDMLDGRNAGVTGTPTVFVNNNIYPGAIPYEDYLGSDGNKALGMKSLIEEGLR